MNASAFSFVPPITAEKPYTVTEINQGVCNILEAGNTLVWVEGELSNFKIASSGHCYFRLKDAQSQIPAVMWKNVAAGLSFVPEDGMQVVAIASIKVYARGGYYQLDMHKMAPSGKGALFAAMEKLKNKLEAEGLFDTAHKRPLPKKIAVIGVITSKNGAAIRDIIKVAHSRSKRTDIVLIDVPVQGDKAAPAIVRALHDMNEWGKVDCIILGRGGGSIEDFKAFNEETVARAVYSSVIPIISAVGHEIDFTISDFVADMRAATPSAAAEMVTNDDEQSRRYFAVRASQMVRRINAFIANARFSYNSLVRRPALWRAMRMVAEARQRTDELDRDATREFTRALGRARDRLGKTASQLDALSPLNIMARGFSVVTKADGKTVKDIINIADGERLNIRFYKGNAQADIVKRF
jgi:exodeoxyribonuclease VII large subunit